jgi:glutamyl/glutaminyl-tRNA synthetase
MSDTPRDTERVDVEESDDEKNVFVVDPENYQKTKKLEIIYKTKKEVLNVRKNRDDITREFNRQYRDDGFPMYEKKLARTVAQYGSELLPLIEEGLENGTLSEEDLTTELSPEHTEMEVLMFIQMDGRVNYEGKKGEMEFAPETNSIAIYRQLDRIQRKLGLGLELREDKGPAEI